MLRREEDMEEKGRETGGGGGDLALEVVLQSHASRHILMRTPQNARFPVWQRKTAVADEIQRTFEWR